MTPVERAPCEPISVALVVARQPGARRVYVGENAKGTIADSCFIRTAMSKLSAVLTIMATDRPDRPSHTARDLRTPPAGRRVQRQRAGGDVDQLGNNSSRLRGWSGKIGFDVGARHGPMAVTTQSWKPGKFDH